MTKLVHVVVGFPRKPMMDLLQTSSERAGCRFVALPREWSATKGFFTWATRLSLVRSYIDSGEVGPYTVVLFTDAYDVLVIEHSDVILEKFYSSGADILHGAENNFWPPENRQEIKAQFDQFESKWRYPNGGGYIGFAWAIKFMLDYCVRRIEAREYDTSKPPDDQALIQEFFLKYRESDECRARLDAEPSIFCCLNTCADDFVLSRSRVRSARSRGSVSILHANGGKVNMDILTRYWSLIKGTASEVRHHDLRIVVSDSDPLAFDVSMKKLTPRSNLKMPATFLVVRGERHAIALSPTHGLLTFTPDGRVMSDGRLINYWELLSVRGAVTTHHGRLLRDYCESGAGRQISPAPPPLSVMLQPWFDDLLGLLDEFGDKL